MLRRGVSCSVFRRGESSRELDDAVAPSGSVHRTRFPGRPRVGCISLLRANSCGAFSMVRIRWNPPELNGHVAWEKRVVPEWETETRQGCSMRAWRSRVRGVPVFRPVGTGTRNTDFQRRRPASSATARRDPGSWGALGAFAERSWIALVSRCRGMDAPSKTELIVWSAGMEPEINDR